MLQKLMIEMSTMPIGTERRANQSNNNHHQTIFTGWMPILSPKQQCECTKSITGKIVMMMMMMMMMMMINR